MASLEEILAASATHHHRLCPRQVLGVRMGMLAGEWLDIELPQIDKRVLAIVETDGCAVDGMAAATNCRVGRRTMRIEDYGKVAATFVDTETGRAVRIVPHAEARARAAQYAPEATDRWHAQLLGYQRIPTAELLLARPVRLLASIEAIVSRASHRARCAACGEEVLNQREVTRDGATLCRPCSGESYYCCDKG